ncbi:MAG: tetratricopeptide repeat protein [bacterium]
MAIISICRILSTLLLLSNSESAYELFSIGNNLELEGNITEAVKYYEKVLEIAPETPEIYNTLANALFKLRKFDRGISVAKQGLALFPEDITIYNTIAIGNIGKNDLPMSIKYYKQALLLAPDNIDIFNSLSILYEGVGDFKSASKILLSMPDTLKTPETYVRLGTIAGKVNDHHQAIEYFRRGYAMDTTDMIALIGIGTGYDLLNVKDSAIYYYEQTLKDDSLILTVGKRLVDLYSDIDDFQRLIRMANTVLELDHFDGHVRRSLGYAFYKIGELDQALDEFLIASRLDPGDTYSRFYAGKIHLDKGNYKTAMYEIEQALKINPDFIELWVYLGFIAIDLKNFETAEYAFTQAAFHGGDLVQVYYLLGVSAEMQDEDARAYFHYNKALGMDQDNLSSLEALANLCERMGKKQETLKIFHKIIEIDTTNATALNYVGYAYAEKNERLEYALELIDKALLIEPANGYYIDSRGWVYYRMGEYEKALEDMERAASIVEDAVIFEHLGDVYIKLEKHDKAREAYKKALVYEPNSKELKTKIKALQ